MLTGFFSRKKEYIPYNYYRNFTSYFLCILQKYNNFAPVKKNISKKKYTIHFIFKLLNF